MYKCFPQNHDNLKTTQVEVKYMREARTEQLDNYDDLNYL